MKKYLHAALRSFHDPVQYREVRAGWRGFGGLYALFMGGVTAFFLLVYVGIMLVQFKATMLPQVLDRLPEIHVARGEVSIRNGPEGPIQFNYNSGVIMIDLNRSEDEFKKIPNLWMGVGRDFIVIQTRKGYETSPIDPNKQFVINRQMVEEFFSGYYLLALPIIFPILAFGQFVFYLIYMLAVGLMSYVVTAFLREEYNFETRLRLSALALTPPTLLSLMISFFGHQTGVWLIPLVALLYLYVMIMMMRRLPSTV